MKKISISNPTIIPFTTAGISADSRGRVKSLTFLNRYIRDTAIRVATEPNIISYGPSVDIELMFAIIQPTVRPYMADGVKIASTVRASATLN